MTTHKTFLRFLNTEITRTHELSKEKGWWSKETSEANLYALFHSEVSEAVEEERKPKLGNIKERDLYYFHEGDPTHHSVIGDNWSGVNPKPEGTGVELVDMVTRILDYMGHKECKFPEDHEEDHEEDSKALAGGLAVFTELHVSLSAAYLYAKEKEWWAEESEISYLTEAVCLVDDYFLKNGWKFVKVFMEKQNYNCTRSYRHGGNKY